MIEFYESDESLCDTLEEIMESNGLDPANYDMDKVVEQFYERVCDDVPQYIYDSAKYYLSDGWIDDFLKEQ